MILFFENLIGLMSFTSVTYLLFLALAVIIYYLLPGARTRAMWLLFVSSTFFMLYSPRWFWVICLVTLFTYVLGRWLGRISSRTGRCWALGAGVTSLALLLVAVKYAGVASGLANKLFAMTGVGWAMPVLQLVMPLGISFWVFQTIAYLIDVFRGRAEPITNVLYFAASVIFFPIMAMGPITRIDVLVPQLAKKHTFSYKGMQSGLLLIGWGFFKKLMIADRLAVFVNTVFDNPHAYSGTYNGLLFGVAAVFFAVQLYTDFSGYTDIVRGSARIFGVNLPINFDAPYFARSAAEFWRKWHMTLMDWLKQYIYIPLGGNRKGVWRKRFNIMVTFAVSGLWHGAGLSYLVWGLLNGLYQVAGEVLAPLNGRIVKLFRIDRTTFAHKLFQTLLTFLLITIAWVFFRANTLSDAIHILSRMFIPTIWVFTDGSMLEQGLNASELAIAYMSILLVWGVDFLKSRRGFDWYGWIVSQPLYFRWFCYYALIFVVMIFGHYGGMYDSADFVYFKF